jgi:hypothetical protein
MCRTQEFPHFSGSGQQKLRAAREVAACFRFAQCEKDEKSEKGEKGNHLEKNSLFSPDLASRMSRRKRGVAFPAALSLLTYMNRLHILTLYRNDIITEQKSQAPLTSSLLPTLNPKSRELLC